MKKLLVVVDMQNDFVTGALGSDEAKMLVAPMKEYIKAFDGDVVFTRDTHTEDYMNTQEGKKLPVPHCIKGTKGHEIVDGLKELVKDDTKVFDKETFGSKDFGKFIADNKDKYEEIYFCGVCTGICVISNVLMAKANACEIPVKVLADLCACVTPDSHETALNAMETCQVDVLNRGKEYWKPENQNFDAVKEKNRIVEWIREWFNQNGPKANAVLGISGGKDSTIVAALLVEALGKDRVYGVLMPQGVQPDIDDSRRVVETLGIRNTVVNIGKTVDTLKEELEGACGELVDNRPALSRDTGINIPPRVRMTTVYAVGQSLPQGARVANTCNKSEDYIGYSTKYGDAAGDFAPIADYSVTEVRAIGAVLDSLKDIQDLVQKTPSDGLCGQSDEDRFGFTYDTLDRYMAGEEIDPEIAAKIDRMHIANLHKLRLMPVCKR